MGPLRARLASRNPHKLRELRRVLPGWRLEPLAASDYPPETGATYVENARGKARYGLPLAPAGEWVLGEDSGLEVDALDGRPGLYTARYAPEGAEAIAKLLRELADVPPERRGARYVCELVAAGPDGAELRGTGVLAGAIAPRAAGGGGFGFDPVFVPAGATRTVAELGDAWKARRSHRALAAAALAAHGPELFVRPARDGDAAALAELRRELVRAQRALAPGHPSLQHDGEAAGGRAADAGEELLVAELDGAVVGFVRLALRARPWGLAAEVAPLVVAEAARGAGLGGALLAAAERRAALAGADALRLDVILENEPARRFYERAGYRPLSQRYGKPLP